MLDQQRDHYLGLEGGAYALPYLSIGFNASCRLRCTADELATMQAFIATEFLPVPPGFESYPGQGAMLWPYVSLDPEMMTIGHEQIPPGELAVHRWARVHATDGAIGRVDEFL